jgi:hypothetical protein
MKKEDSIKHRLAMYLEEFICRKIIGNQVRKNSFNAGLCGSLLLIVQILGLIASSNPWPNDLVVIFGDRRRCV